MISFKTFYHAKSTIHFINAKEQLGLGVAVREVRDFSHQTCSDKRLFSWLTENNTECSVNSKEHRPIYTHTLKLPRLDHIQSSSVLLFYEHIEREPLVGPLFCSNPIITGCFFSSQMKLLVLSR